MLDSHLEKMSHPTDYPAVYAEVGEVKAARTKDAAGSLVDTFTTYDVTVFFQQQGVYYPVDFEFVPVLGQFAAGDIEVEVDLLPGQKVVVGFLGGDLNRPYIQGAFPGHATTVARVESDGARVRIKANGAEVMIDNNGNISCVPKSGAELTLAGALGDAGLKKLIHEGFISAFNSHTHTGVTTGPGVSGTPSTAITTSVATITTKAK